MDKHKRSTVFGAALIFMGIVFGAGVGAMISGGEAVPQTTISTQQTTVLPVGPVQPSGVIFSAEDAQLASIRYAQDCDYRVSVKQLVTDSLVWNLKQEVPTVLIIHTHASESYTKTNGQNYEESSDYRTLDTDYNMVAVGDRLTQLLEQAGISVIHDRTIHDHPSYSSSYDNSRRSVAEYLQDYPSIQVVLDLHRDAALLSDGTQYAPTATVDGKQVAQIMMVVGSDASGMYHPDWKENLAAALKLQVLLEKSAPGITRSTILRAQRFNHDLSAGAMIVEIGAAGNTIEQAMGAVPYLAQAIIQLQYGATEVELLQ